MVPGLKGNSYEEKCEELGLETLERRRNIQDMAQVYKLVHGIDKVERVKLFDHCPRG
jgi:hypothetical protein